MATHGTPNDYDSHVPEIFYGPWFVTGKYTQRALVADMAPTLAAIAGVSPIEPLDGRAHVEAIRKPYASSVASYSRWSRSRRASTRLAANRRAAERVE